VTARSEGLELLAFRSVVKCRPSGSSG